MALALSITDSQNGGGLTATISGSSGGTVTVYGQRTDLLQGTPTWSTIGSRTGNGTVSATVTPGIIWFYAVESSTLSPLVMKAITYAGNSVYDRCLDYTVSRLQTAIAASAFPAGESSSGWVADRVQRQNIVDVATFRSRAPVIIVSLGQSSETESKGTSARDHINYPVNVTIFDRWSSQRVITAASKHLLWRERIRRIFHNQIHNTTVPENMVCRVQWGQVTGYTETGGTANGAYEELEMYLTLIYTCQEFRGI